MAIPSIPKNVYLLKIAAPVISKLVPVKLVSEQYQYPPKLSLLFSYLRSEGEEGDQITTNHELEGT